jgi:predicted AAA+ superfamily ATPase
MEGFDLADIGDDMWRTLWNRGGFPRSFLADSDDNSASWREQFIRSFVERDLAQLGFDLPPLAIRRFFTMLAHYHGQTWNSAEIAASLGVSDHTSRRYLDILAGAYMIRLLPPWFENLGKRQRKSPKVYLRDSGLMHTLLGLARNEAVMAHPKCGASWEGFAIDQILQCYPSAEAYYWAVHSGPELDLLLFHQGKRLGFEIKWSDAPSLTKSMQSAIEALKLDHLFVVYPGSDLYPIANRIEAIPLSQISTQRKRNMGV